MSPRGPLDLGAAARTPLPDRVEPRTVPDLLARAVREAPALTALVAYSHGSGEVAVTHRELADAAARVAGGFADLGVGHGDRVGILLTNGAALEAHLAIHGAHRAGAIAVPINPRASADELLWCLDAAGCRLLLYEPSLAEKVSAIREHRGDLAMVALGDDEATRWSQMLDHAPLAQVEIEPGDGASWGFTSGTTGFPKIVAHTHATSVACGVQIAEGWDLRRGDVYVNAHPMFTASGTNTDLLAALWALATNVVEARFDAAESVARVNRLGATSVMWMTPMLRLIFDADALPGLEDGPLRRVMYGGQAMSPEFHLAVDDRIVRERGLEAIHMIGLSEAGPGGILLDSEFHRERLGAVGNRGFSRELTEFELLDPEGEPVAAGANGELCYRNPSIMQGYVGNEEASAEALRGGWLHSGDLCRRDEDGFVYFVDRMKDVIRRGGVNIASAEIERVVGESVDVAEVAAVPHPHPVLGEVVRVVVVRRPGSEIDADAVIAHAAAQLADYKVPRVVDFVDELPRNEMGKVTKALLRE
jgi:acyl-CoA synthetase (AMP-forming)/AMP-acid ligase II